MRKILVILFSVIIIHFIYMSVETWGLMPKSQIDNETIEEAIERLIAVHEHEPTSHMGENEAIEAHRKSEIIDHLASSVYDDKLAYDRNSFTLSFANLDMFDKGPGVENSGYTTAYVYSANTSSIQWIYAFMGDMVPASFFYYTKKPRFITNFMLTQTTSQEGYITVGDRDSNEGFGVKILNNKLYGFYHNTAGSEVTQEIMTLTANVPYKLEVRVPSLSQIDFFVNNSLIGSMTGLSLPATNNYIWLVPWIDFKSTTSTGRELFMRDFLWEADL